MMDDFRPQRPGQPTDKPDSFQPAYTERPETYEALPNPQVTPEPTEPVSQAPKKKSGAMKWFVRSIVVLLLAGLGAVAYWQWAEAESAKRALSDSQAQLRTAQDAVKKEDVKTEPDTPTATEGEDFKTFIAEYNKMATASVAVTDVDRKAIETAVKDYYKLTTLPAGWQIVIAYKDAKADATTGKPVNALVYWPATTDKPASFFEVTQAADGKWAYNEQR